MPTRPPRPPVAAGPVPPLIDYRNFRMVPNDHLLPQIIVQHGQPVVSVDEFVWKCKARAQAALKLLEDLLAIPTTEGFDAVEKMVRAAAVVRAFQDREMDCHQQMKEILSRVRYRFNVNLRAPARPVAVVRPPTAAATTQPAAAQAPTPSTADVQAQAPTPPTADVQPPPPPAPPLMRELDDDLASMTVRVNRLTSCQPWHQDFALMNAREDRLEQGLLELPQSPPSPDWSPSRASTRTRLSTSRSPSPQPPSPPPPAPPPPHRPPPRLRGSVSAAAAASSSATPAAAPALAALVDGDNVDDDAPVPIGAPKRARTNRSTVC